MNRQQRRAEKSSQQVSPQVVQKLFVAAYRHHQSRRLDQAIAGYREVIELAPNYADAHNNLGMTMNEMGRAEDAIACYLRAIELKPDFSNAHFNLGNVLFLKLGRAGDAVTCYFRATQLRPELVEAHHNLGLALMAMERAEDAIACYLRAIQFKPNFAEAHHSLGTALMARERVDDAIGCYRKAIELKPDYSEAHCGLGIALREQGHLDDAIGCYRKAIELKPDYSDAHHCLALALLGRGDMAAGWEEYEWRWMTHQTSSAKRAFVEPRWRGEVANGQTILIYAEQGIGDTIQFCRYAELVAARGLRVIMEVQKPLVRLLRGFPGVDAVIEKGDPLPPFDFQIPMMSLPSAIGNCPVFSSPRAFGTSLVPSNVPYLTPSPDATAYWRDQLAARPGIKVGVNWRGNPAQKRDRMRSTTPAWFSRFLDISGLCIVSLAWPGLDEECRALGPQTSILNAGPQLSDIADTAGLLANLDLVISTDTSVCHLAGALGLPTWTLLDFGADWRWLTEREDSPWYPTMRLFRQRRPGDWTSVVEQVRIALNSFVEKATN